MEVKKLELVDVMGGMNVIYLIMVECVIRLAGLIMCFILVYMS